MNLISSVFCTVCGFLVWIFEFFWIYTKRQQHELSGTELVIAVLLTYVTCFLFLFPYIMEAIQRKHRSQTIEQIKTVQDRESEETVEYIPPPRKQGDNTPTWQKKNWPGNKINP